MITFSGFFDDTALQIIECSRLKPCLNFEKFEKHANNASFSLKLLVVYFICLSCFSMITDTTDSKTLLIIVMYRYTQTLMKTCCNQRYLSLHDFTILLVSVYQTHVLALKLYQCGLYKTKTRQSLDFFRSLNFTLSFFSC